MFGIFKSHPSKRLKKEHSRKLKDAMLAQRRGDIRTYSQLTSEADELHKKIDQLESLPNET